MTALTLTLIGRDRPGLVQSLSERVTAAGGNWLESRMARLADRFAGILLVEVPDAEVERFLVELDALAAQGLKVTVERGSEEPTEAQRILRLELMGQDRPGIVRDIAQALAGRGVNIEELTTRLVSASFSGERMFEVEARLKVPAGLPADELRGVLERLANEIMVELHLDQADA
ncbi:MAG: glycine cleavage system protein R [Geminicoccaceae bacterium]